MATRTGLTTNEFWSRLLSLRVPDGSGEIKRLGSIDDMRSYGRKLTKWQPEHHRMEALQLVVCLITGPTAMALAPELVHMLGGKDSVGTSRCSLTLAQTHD